MTNSLIIPVIALVLIIIAYNLFFTPSQRRERRLIKKRKEEKMKKRLFNVEELQKKYYSKKLFLSIDRDSEHLMDEQQNRMCDFDKSIILIKFWRENYFIKILPVIITGIELSPDNDFEAMVEFQISTELYPFTVVYLGIETIAHSPVLGEIALPRDSYTTYELGQVVQVMFKKKRFHSVFDKIEIKVIGEYSVILRLIKLFRHAEKLFCKGKIYTMQSRGGQQILDFIFNIIILFHVYVVQIKETLRWESYKINTLL